MSLWMMVALFVSAVSASAWSWPWSKKAAEPAKEEAPAVAGKSMRCEKNPKCDKACVEKCKAKKAEKKAAYKAKKADKKADCEIKKADKKADQGEKKARKKAKKAEKAAEAAVEAAPASE